MRVFRGAVALGLAALAGLAVYVGLAFPEVPHDTSAGTASVSSTQTLPSPPPRPKLSLLTISPTAASALARTFPASTGPRGLTRSVAAVVGPQVAAARRPKLVAKLFLQMWISGVVDRNSNGFLEPGDAVVYSYRVANVGQFRLTSVKVVDAKLTADLVGVKCPQSQLLPGQSMVCSSGEYKVSRYQSVRGVGSNSARASAHRPNGTLFYSNRATETHGKTAGPDPTPAVGVLAMTGAEPSTSLLAALALIISGVLMRFGQTVVRLPLFRVKRGNSGRGR